MLGLVPRYTEAHELRKATHEDIDYLSTHLRTEDKEEIKACSGENPRNGIRIAIDSGGLVAVTDGVPWIIWGNIDNSVWCLATPLIHKYKMFFVRASRLWLRSLKFPYLVCYTDSRNKEHHKWLRATSFEKCEDPYFFTDPSVAFHEYRRGQINV